MYTLVERRKVNRERLQETWASRRQGRHMRSSPPRLLLGRRIPDQDPLRHQTAAWEERRNTARATIEWRFTTADAPVKLKKLYPTLKPSE